MLRIFSFLLLAVSLFLLSSCTKDPLSETISGTKWELESYQVSSCDFPEDNISELVVVNGCITVDGDTICNYTMEFVSATQGQFSLFADMDFEVDDFDYSVLDDSNTIIIDGEDESTITVDGGTMTIVVELDDGCIGQLIMKKQ